VRVKVTGRLDAEESEKRPRLATNPTNLLCNARSGLEAIHIMLQFLGELS